MNEIKIIPLGIDAAREKIRLIQGDVESIQTSLEMSEWKGRSADGMLKAMALATECKDALLKLLLLTNYKLGSTSANFMLTDEELADLHRVFGEGEVSQIIQTDDVSLGVSA